MQYIYIAVKFFFTNIFDEQLKKFQTNYLVL